MKRLILSALVFSLTFVLVGAARADHEIGHDHPFCAQGGGQVSSGGEGGTIPPEGAITHANDGPIPDGTVLIPRHLGAQFGEDDPRGIDPDAQFIEIDADDIEDIEGTGSSGSAFHGGHGGGPGGGQGGSTFFGAGDGGCSPVAIPTRGRPVTPGRRLPVTGGLAEQLGLMSGLMVSVGLLLSMVGRRRVALAVPAEAQIAVEEPAPVIRRGQQVVSRLKEQMAGAWRSGGRRG